GSLVFIPGPVSNTSTLWNIAMFDRQSGGADMLKLVPGPYELPRLSPDGKRIAFGTNDGKDANIWIVDLSAATAPRRLTFGGRNSSRIWAADGQRIAFQSDGEGDGAVFWQPADGSGTAERLTKPEPGTSHTPESWATDNQRFLYDATKDSAHSLWTFSLP